MVLNAPDAFPMSASATAPTPALVSGGSASENPTPTTDIGTASAG